MFSRSLSRVLALALTERPDVRVVCASALRNIVRYACIDNANTDLATFVAQYSANFLPILFNIYASNDGDTANGTDEKIVCDICLQMFDI